MHLVDTHCHIDTYKDPAAIVDRIEASRVYTIAVTNLPSAFGHLESLLRGKKYLRPALGLHPQNAYRRHHELAGMFDLLDRTRYIGEIGLDYATSDSADRQVQRHIFSQILERCSSAGHKILTIHSRRAAREVISAIGPHFPGKIILHWFSGSQRELEKAILNGYYFSINPSMAKARRTADYLSIIPRDRLLTESDGPYVRVRGQPAAPTDVSHVTHSIAALLALDHDTVQKLIFDNFIKLVATYTTDEIFEERTFSIGE